MPLIKNGKEVDDPWQHVADDDPLPAAPTIVSYQRWIDQRDVLIAHSHPVGVLLPNDLEVDDLADELDHWPIILLQFPIFRDGRAYSQARILRERLGYRGEIRATGHIIKDQFHFLQRCGVDAVETDGRASALDWQKAKKEMSFAYQPAGDRRPSIVALRVSASGGGTLRVSDSGAAPPKKT